MQPKTLKNRRWHLCLLILLTLIGSLWLPDIAAAYDFTQQTPAIGGNGEVCPGYGLTRRIMPCIKETILDATYAFLMPFSRYLANFVAVLCTLAVMFWGIAMAGGRTSAPITDLGIMMLKIAFVGMMTAGIGMGNIYSMILDSLDDMIGIVTRYAVYANVWNCPQFNDPLPLQLWNTVDCAIETLVGGIYSNFSLALGLVGFLTACLLSQAAGFFIALIGFYIVIQFLYAIARALYLFISAYMGIALLMIVSPIFIPLILTRVTKPYFDKYIKLLLSFWIQPFLVGVFVSILAAGYNATVYTAPFSLAHALAGADADDPNFTLGGWLSGSGSFGKSKWKGKAVNIDSKQTMKFNTEPTDTGVASVVGSYAPQIAQNWQGDLFQMLGIGDNTNSVTKERDLNFFQTYWDIRAVDFRPLADNKGMLGPNGDVTVYIINLFIAFLMAAVTAYIFMTMLDYLPYISSGLAGKPIGIPTLGTGSLAAPGAKQMQSMNNNIFNLRR